MNIRLIITIILTLLISSSYAFADEPSGFRITETNVETVTINPAGKVIISCLVSHPAGSLQIKAVGATAFHGRWITTYPVLFDDGTHGDKVAGDGIYSLKIQAADKPCEEKIVFYAADNDGNEVESEPVILIVK